MAPLTLHLLPGRYAVARLPAGADVPGWALTAGDDFASITRTVDELSVVCLAARVPEASPGATGGARGLRVEGGWRALRVAGPLDFSLVGILADLCGALAAAGVSVFVVSTYDTDVVLVRETKLAAAREALEAQGHTVQDHTAP